MQVTYALYLTYPNSDCKGVTQTSQSLRKTPCGRVGEWDSCVVKQATGRELTNDFQRLK